MRYPNVYRLRTLINQVLACDTHKQVGTTFVPARPLGYPSLRVRIYAAWLVFTGRADAVIWPENIR